MLNMLFSGADCVHNLKEKRYIYVWFSTGFYQLKVDKNVQTIL